MNFGNTALCEPHAQIAKYCPYCEIDRLKTANAQLLKEREVEIKIMNGLADRIGEAYKAATLTERARCLKIIMKPVSLGQLINEIVKGDEHEG